MSDDLNAAAGQDTRSGATPPSDYAALLQTMERIETLLKEQADWASRDQKLQMEQANEARNLARSTARFQLAGHPAAHPAGQGFAGQYMLFGALNGLINALARRYARTRGIDVGRPAGPTALQTARSALKLMLGLSGPLPLLLRGLLRVVPSRGPGLQQASTAMRPPFGGREPFPRSAEGAAAMIEGHLTDPGRELDRVKKDFTDGLRRAVERDGYTERWQALIMRAVRWDQTNLPTWLQQNEFPEPARESVEVPAPAVEP